jgi:glyoxylase-like metal-dependent hydrolase (beta-lactamase superfamily II)
VWAHPSWVPMGEVAQGRGHKGRPYRGGEIMGVETHRFMLGGFACISVLDGTLEVEDSELFANAPEEDLAQAYQEHGIDPGSLALPMVCLVVDTGTHRLLLDTGCGSGAGATAGRLLQNLRAASIEPSEIDFVLLSHSHWDHVGGNTNVQGRAAFPNARYVMAGAEWDALTSQPELGVLGDADAARIRHELLALRDRVDLLGWEGEILPDVEVLAAPGHTVGHVALTVRSEGQELLCIGDAAAHPIHVEHPGWYMVFDDYPEEALRTRRRLLERAVAENALVFDPHFPFPAVGHVAERQGRWQWQPLRAMG